MLEKDLVLKSPKRTSNWWDWEEFTWETKLTCPFHSMNLNKLLKKE